MIEEDEDLINLVDGDTYFRVWRDGEFEVSELPKKKSDGSIILSTDSVVRVSDNVETNIDIDLDKKHELFLVGGQTVSIYDIISKVSRMGSLNLKINQKEIEKTFINVKSLKAKKIFNWNREFNL